LLSNVTYSPAVVEGETRKRVFNVVNYQKRAG
jgi:hypothetical protein